jgi:hypothetical protein
VIIIKNLKHYQSHKKVHGTPMTRGEFIETKKRPLDGGSPDDPGYFVVYNKDTKDHYESWSPKNVFDDGYTEISL